MRWHSRADAKRTGTNAAPTSRPSRAHPRTQVAQRGGCFSFFDVAVVEDAEGFVDVRRTTGKHPAARTCGREYAGKPSVAHIAPRSRSWAPTKQ